MDLPRALSPWGSYLTLFPRDLALSLGPVLQRLSSAVGPLRVRRSDTDGEVDGFDGLARRGPYERLLATEWLLADEMPEEFLRRASMGEHTFLKVSRPEPGGSRTSVAVFDAGPAQLGSPRIAQLAALIVLARRAEAAGVRFAWGVLQDPEAPLFPEVTESGVLRLLQSRTPHEASDAQIGAWRARLQGWKESDDVWMVGPPRLGALPAARGAAVLQIWDVLDPEARKVAVRVRRSPGTPQNEVSLELPDDSVCARLLRDPFVAAASPLRRLDRGLIPSSNLLFAGNGSKLFARAAGGGVVAFSLPHSPRAEMGPPLACDPGAFPVAAGLAGKQVAVVTAGPLSPIGASPTVETPRGASPSPEVPAVSRGFLEMNDAAAGGDAPRGVSTVGRISSGPKGDVILHTFHKRGGRGPTVALPGLDEHRFHGGHGAEPTPLRPLLTAGGHEFLVDAAGGLFRLTEAGPHRGLQRVAARVSAVAAVSARLAFVEPAAAGSPARIAVVGGGGPAISVVLDGPGDRAFFGYGGKLAHPEHGLVAVEHPRRMWEILSNHRSQGSTFLTPFETTQVVGVAWEPQRHEAGLVLLEEDWRTLLIAGRNWTRKLLTAPAEIEHVAVSSALPRIAYSTVSGEIAVCSLDREAPLFRLLPEDGP
ncbi:MAG TPA: hypothetical protein VF756_07530 [Thermoanaerobaculia bacterium]